MGEVLFQNTGILFVAERMNSSATNRIKSSDYLFLHLSNEQCDQVYQYQGCTYTCLVRYHTLSGFGLLLCPITCFKARPFPDILASLV